MGKRTGFRSTTAGDKAPCQDYGVGRHECPGSDRAARSTQRQSVDAKYYAREILENSLLPSLARTVSTGSVLKKKMVPEMSSVIFQQDGAPAHASKEAQNWCHDKLPSFWDKDTWPGNSPDLNPIENLWGILKAQLNEAEPCSSIEQLTALLKTAWSKIKPSTLRNLVASMPQRVSKCIALRGEYIGR